MMDRRCLLMLCVVTSLLAFACVGPDADATATQEASDAATQKAADAATQTAEAPTPTPTRTPTPTSTPTPTLTPTPSPIYMEADGSGDYATLGEAVEEAYEGATIILGPGTYELEEPLTIRRPLQLVGAGMEETEIVAYEGSYVVRFSGDGPYVVEDIAFRYDGDDSADVVVVRGSEVTFSRCLFTGSVYVQGEGDRAGLRLSGNTTGLVQDCVAEENDLIGILVEDQAEPTLEGNICSSNGLIGLAYGGRSGGVARRNECSDNGIGIVVIGRAEPTLEENICRSNEAAGIIYGEQAGGVARGNECTENGVGILLLNSSDPELVDNDCHDNEMEDIADDRD